MSERLPNEVLVSMYGDFLRMHLGAGDPLGLQKWLQTPQSRELSALQDNKKTMDRLTEEEFKRTQELMGEHYGFMMSIGDQRTVMTKLLQSVRDVPTLSVGCGIAPQEIFLASNGIIRSDILATDLTTSSVSRAANIAKVLGVSNITFESVSGADISHDNEFDQVFMLDSLHWMKNWRACVRAASSALRPDGNMIVVYSKHSPRVQINELRFAEELSNNGMDVTNIGGLTSEVGTPRIFATAIKRPAAGLIIPS